MNNNTFTSRQLSQLKEVVDEAVNIAFAKAYLLFMLFFVIVAAIGGVVHIGPVGFVVCEEATVIANFNSGSQVHLETRSGLEVFYQNKSLALAEKGDTVVIAKAYEKYFPSVRSGDVEFNAINCTDTIPLEGVYIAPD